MDNPTDRIKLQDTVKALTEEIQQLKQDEEKLLGCLTLNMEIQMQEPTIPLNITEQKKSLFASLTLRISQNLDLDEIFNTTVTEIRQLLNNERVIIYQLNSDNSGKFVAESVVEPQWSILGRTVVDSFIQENWVEYYQQGRIQMFADLDTAELTPCHTEILANLQVKASLVVPILLDIRGKNHKLLEHGEKQTSNFPRLWGLLIAQNCSCPRNWQSDEIELFQQLSTHFSIAIQQDLLVKNLQKEILERQQIELDLTAVKKQLEVKDNGHNRQLLETEIPL
ncbi:MAG: GAF domain-containing protein, partial [Microcoleaceae cyanobacterium]